MRSFLGVVVAAVFLAACGGGAMFGSGVTPGGGGGATVGGAKDLGLARAKVDAGQVPLAEDFVAEGLYAEHDLPVAGPACDRAFCIRAASAVAPGLDGKDHVAWVQLGLSSGISPEALQRPPLDLALIIDVSCSMTGSGIESAREAARLAIDNLGEGDLLTVVEFDDAARLVIAPTPVTDKDALKRIVDGLRPKGSTCIECGLELGYQRLDSTANEGRASRAVLLTDAMPNVGATGEGEFTELLESAAGRGIGTTVMGVNLDFGQTLVRRISASRGANAFYLGEVADAQRLFGEDFKFWVTPVAYDLDLDFRAAAPLALAAGYGIPGADAAGAKMHVATVFLSRERGALVLRLDQAAEPEAPLGTLALSYRDPEGALVEDSLAVAAPTGAAPAWSSPGVRKALALTRFVLAAKEACNRRETGDAAGGAALAESAAVQLAAEAEALGDPALAAEAAFARQLADLLAVQR